MVRLKDIALQASVSSATVSRILNKDDSLAVTDETREKVLRIADELGYQPSAKKTEEPQPQRFSAPDRRCQLPVTRRRTAGSLFFSDPKRH